MKTLLAAIAATIGISSLASAKSIDYGFPELNVVKTVELDATWGCPSQSTNHSLFLSDASKRYEDAELFLSACYGRKEVEAESGYRGMSLSLIADLGKVNLDKVTLYTAKAPEWVRGKSHNFRKSTNLVLGNTYSVIFSTQVSRGVLVFTVDSIEGQKVRLRYTVKMYEYIEDKVSAPGMDYGAESKSLN